MKFFKGLLVFLLVIIIIGGIGFLGFSLFTGDVLMGNMDMSSDTAKNDTTKTEQNNKDNMNMSGMNNSTDNMNQNTAVPNPDAGKNREQLSKAIDYINQAMDLITIDPYSNATVSEDTSMNMNGMNSQGSGTINIYPRDNSSVNIAPDNTQASTNTNQSAMGDMNMGNTNQNTKAIKHVYDQDKLQQLHNGIYTIAQGILAINDLSDSLMEQSMVLEQQPFTYQTYVTRYNNALKNQKDLESAMTLLDSASVLINVNPYASDSGYSYDNDSMKRLHDGVYKYAQGMAMLKVLKENLVSQMKASTISAQNSVYGSGQMNMNNTGFSLFGNINLSSVINTIILVLVTGLIIGIMGSILSLFRHKPRING